MINVKIAENVGAYFKENSIGLSLFREGKKREASLVENRIEYTLSHETVHLIIYNIENALTSWLFDIIDYQIHLVEEMEIPESFLYGNKDIEEFKEEKKRIFKNTEFTPLHKLMLGKYHLMTKGSRLKRFLKVLRVKKNV